MSNTNSEDNIPGPFKNGRLTEPEAESETRPTRVNPAPDQVPGEQAGQGQTRATPARPKTGPEGQPADQTQAHPVYDPHGQTQELPVQAAQTGPGPGGLSQPQPAATRSPQTLRAGPVTTSTARKPLSGIWQFARRNWLWGVLAVVLVGIMVSGGAYGGYLSGRTERQAQAEAAAVMDLTQQVALGLEDLQAGRYDVARQRFEFVLNQNPNFPGAADGLVQALQVLNATATPSPPPATPTLTPTRDLRPVEDLLAQALAQMKNSDWSGVIDTLNGLRKEDPNFQVTRVDGYLYIALRYQGVDKILNQSNLEGGIYDLALAEQFGPLDAEALGTRNLARLYIIGSSFWEALPEQAVYYFSQVAAAAPYLRDASGWTARERYRMSLVQYGDMLAASNNWCEAQVQYENALSMQDDPRISDKAQNAAQICSPPTEVPTVTATETLTPTPSATFPGETAPVATTPVATTPVPTTAVATTPAVTTEVPTTAAPTTPVPTTAIPTTPIPTTPVPTTEAPPPDATTPVPPSETPTPTETTASAPADTNIVPDSKPASETPTVTPTGQTAGAAWPMRFAWLVSAAPILWPLVVYVRKLYA